MYWASQVPSHPSIYYTTTSVSHFTTHKSTFQYKITIITTITRLLYNFSLSCQGKRVGQLYCLCARSRGLRGSPSCSWTRPCRCPCSRDCCSRARLRRERREAGKRKRQNNCTVARLRRKEYLIRSTYLVIYLLYHVIYRIISF